MIKITKFVREKRAEKRMNQTQFARLCHVSQSTISNVENDLPITKESAEKIAKAFRQQMAEIVDEPERVELSELAESLPIDAVRELLKMSRSRK